MTTTYAMRLQQAIHQKQTPALVGLDPRFDWIPQSIVASARERYSDDTAVAAVAFEEFSIRIIDVVASLVPAVKPQAAFFEQYGSDGCFALQRVVRYARAQGLMVILDAKRGDIGSTAEAYAEAYLAGEDPKAAAWAADALTVNPYLGADTLQPFVNVAHQRGAGIYVLVKTSNPGAATFQDVCATDGQTVYQRVAGEVERLACEECGSTSGSRYGSIGAVVGATYPQQLKSLRQDMPHVPLLIPGYGSQGGSAADVASAFDEHGMGALVNNSRGINFAYRNSPWKEEFGEKHWEDAVFASTKAMIDDLRQQTPAAVLLQSK